MQREADVWSPCKHCPRGGAVWGGGVGRVLLETLEHSTEGPKVPGEQAHASGEGCWAACGRQERVHALWAECRELVPDCESGRRISPGVAGALKRRAVCAGP